MEGLRQTPDYEPSLGENPGSAVKEMALMVGSAANGIKSMAGTFMNTVYDSSQSLSENLTWYESVPRRATIWVAQGLIDVGIGILTARINHRIKSDD